MIFDERLTELRKAKGLSQKDCALELGMPDASKYNKWENGANRPDYETVCQLAKYFNVTTDYLLGASDCKSLDNDVIYKITGLSDNAIERIKQLNGLGLNNLASDLIFSGGFMNALCQMNEMLKLNLQDKHHVIITRDELDKLNNGEKVTGQIVSAGAIRNMFATKAKEDIGKAIDEALKNSEKDHPDE